MDLDLRDWEILASVASRPMAETPLDGLALAAILRGHLERRSSKRVTAVALYSNQIAEIAGRLPPEVRDHVVARLNGLEWVFEKNDEHLERDVVALARGVHSLPPDWPENPQEAVERFRGLLRVPTQARFAETAWRDVEGSHPPIHEVTDASHTLALIRWMTQRITPYPCFLLSSPYVAARLGISRRTLSESLGRGDRLSDKLQRSRYEGFLAEFGGERWWAAGVEELAWDLSGGTLDADRLVDAIRDLTDAKVVTVSPQAVVTVGANYQPEDDAVAIEKAVRIQPDDWPPYAAPAWARLDLVSERPELLALVVEDDRHLLPE